MRTHSPHPALVLAGIFAFIFLLHIPVLHLPYFWDEAGYYVPAARDILLFGDVIPHSTVSNAHPPLVLAWLALWWKVAGFAPLVTRSAMLLVSAFSLLGVFRLAERAASTEVAIASTLCTAVYPVFFAQSSLAQVDLAAAGLTCWGLSAYLEDGSLAVATWFSLAALAKETAILAPAALAAWEIVRRCLPQRVVSELSGPDAESSVPFRRRLLSLSIPLIVLIAWYGYHFVRTGYVFGNPEFFRYNVETTLSLTRFLLALGMRLWQTFGYMHLWVLTLGMLAAMLLPPVEDAGVERKRIAIHVQFMFLAVTVTYVVVMALVGGAVLARYMLPVIPLVMIVGVSTLRRRLRLWLAAIVTVMAAFVVAWFWNPPYGFSPEDNLAYRDYVVLHQDAERFLEARYPMARTLTAWPASDELTRPWLGYVTRPVPVLSIDDFSAGQIMAAAEVRSGFDVVLAFSTKYEPPRPLLSRWKTWQARKTHFFGFHRDLPPQAIATVLGARIVFTEERKGQWVAVLEIERMENARVFPSGSTTVAQSLPTTAPLRSESHR